MIQLLKPQKEIKNLEGIIRCQLAIVLQKCEKGAHLSCHILINFLRSFHGTTIRVKLNPCYISPYNDMVRKISLKYTVNLKNIIMNTRNVF